MPLDRKRKSRRIADPYCLNRAVRCPTFNDYAFSGSLDALTVKRIRQYGIGTENRFKDSSSLKRNDVTMGKFFRQCPVRRHPVIHDTGQITDFRMESASKRNIHFLKSPAYAEHRLSQTDCLPDQRERNAIPVTIEPPVGSRRAFSVFLGMDVWLSSRKDKSVANLQDFVEMIQMG